MRWLLADVRIRTRALQNARLLRVPVRCRHCIRTLSETTAGLASFAIVPHCVRLPPNAGFDVRLGMSAGLWAPIGMIVAIHQTSSEFPPLARQ